LNGSVFAVSAKIVESASGEWNTGGFSFGDAEKQRTVVLAAEVEKLETVYTVE